MLLGTALSLLMRFHLIYPLTPIAGSVMAPEYYLSLLTLHGTLMVFFVLTLAPLNAFGNLVLPEQLGATRMAFPRLNMLSFWISAAAFLFLIASFFAVGGGPLSGWTAYPPLSAVGAIAGPGEGLGQTLWFFSIGLFSIGSLLTAINFIATVIDERGPGMTLMRMPLTCWNWFVTAILSLLAFSVLFAALLLILLDRLARHQLLRSRRAARRRPNHRARRRLSPALAASVLVLRTPRGLHRDPAGHGHRVAPDRKFLAQAGIRLPRYGLGVHLDRVPRVCCVWGHHMFISGLNPWSAIAFSLLTMTIGAPSAVKTFNWIATAWNGSLRLTTAMLFALGFVSIFVTGGLSGLFLGQPEIDAYFHDTYFVVAHFHLIMGIAALFGIFAATFYWFPLLFGRMMNETPWQTAFLSDVRRRLCNVSADALRRIRRQPTTILRLHHVRFSGEA